MGKPEDIGDDADVFVGIEDLAALGVVAGQAATQLSAVLEVEQYGGDQPGDIWAGQEAARTL